MFRHEVHQAVDSRPALGSGTEAKITAMRLSWLSAIFRHPFTECEEFDTELNGAD